MLVVGALLIIAGAFIIIEERRGLRKVGEPAPDFSAFLSSGEKVTLSQYRGKKNVVLFFYPKDFTSGCTAQVCSFRDSFAEIQGLHAVVFGVSNDDAKSHSDFAAHFKLPFSLISDQSGSVAGAYGTSRFRHRLPLMKRVTYVIDRWGIIRAVSRHEFVIARHTSEVIRTLKALQLDEQGAPSVQNQRPQSDHKG